MLADRVLTACERQDKFTTEMEAEKQRYEALQTDKTDLELEYEVCVCLCVRVCARACVCESA